MDSKQIEHIKQLWELIRDDTVTPKQLGDFLLSLSKALKQYTLELKSSNTKSINETLNAVQKIKKSLEKEGSEILLKVKEDIKKQNSTIQEIVSYFESLEVKDGKTPEKGVDYFTESEIQEVKKEIIDSINIDGEEILQKINALPIEPELQIDAKRIKNLPEFKGTVYGGARNLYTLADVNIQNPSNNQVLKYNSTTKLWENGTGGGGGTWGSITGTLSNQTDLQSTLDVKVPYTGATADVNLGNFQLTTLGLNILEGGALTFTTSDGETQFYSDLAGRMGISSPGGGVYGFFDMANIATTDKTFTLPNTSGTIALTSDLSSYQPLDGDLTALSALTGTNTIYYRSAADTWSAVTIGSNLTFSGGTLSATGGGTPGGSDTQFQYNNGGAFGGVPNLTFNDTSGAITFAGSTNTTQWIFRANSTQSASNPIFQFQNSTGTADFGRLFVTADSIGFGAQSLQSASSVNAYENTAFGQYALISVTDGYRNTAVGYFAGDSINTGYQNTLLGDNAGSGLTTGHSNTFIGYNVANNVTIGLGNIYIGSNITATAVGVQNKMNIGNAISGDEINSFSTARVGIGINESNVTAAALSLRASNTNSASLNIASGTAPSSPANGDVWHATNHLYARLNGVTYQLDQQGGGITVGTTTITSGTNTRVLYNNSGVVGEYTISGTGSVVMDNSATLTTPRFANNGYIADANGNELLVFGTTASAVNEIKLSNAATGGNVTIATQGGDTNVSLLFSPKGSGTVKFQNSASTQVEIGEGSFNYTIGRNTGTGYLTFLGTQTTFSGYRFGTSTSATAMELDNSGNLSITGSFSPANLTLTGSASTVSFASGSSSLARDAGNGSLNFNLQNFSNAGLFVKGAHASSVVTTIRGATSANQLEVQYDTSNYFGAKVSSSGAVTFDAVGSSAGFTFSDKVIFDNTARLKGYTVAGLPAGTTGDTAYVTDASSPTYGATVTGGGSTIIPVFYNGTNWICA